MVLSARCCCSSGAVSCSTPEPVVVTGDRPGPNGRRPVGVDDAVADASPGPTLLSALRRRRQSKDCHSPTKARKFSTERPTPLLIPRSPSAADALSTTPCSEASTPSHYTGPIAQSLNTIVDHLWSRMSKYATEVIVNEVQPALRENLPAALQGLTFDAAKCHLGHRPLEFRRVHIVREGQVTANGDMNNLVFKARLDWDADCSILLNFSGQRRGFMNLNPPIDLGIKGLRIKGVMVLELVGLSDAPPFFEGVRAFFNNRPHIDIDFQGTAQRMLNLGLIKRKIIDVIANEIRSAMVLPNRLGYALSPESDIFAIKCPPPEGILTLTVWSADGLLAMDTPWFSRPSSDPYVTVECGAFRFQSDTKFKTLSPVFEYTATIPVTEAAHQRVRFELFDLDYLSNDDFLGRLSVSVASMIKWGNNRRVKLKLEDESGVRGGNGSITISATWEPLRLATEVGHFDRPGIVFVGVQSLSNIARFGNGATYWVTASCSGLSPGFPEPSPETDHAVELPPTLPEDLASAIETDSMKNRLAILRKYDMSVSDMAQVLQVDAKELSNILLERTETQAAGELAAKVVDSTEVKWEKNCFIFPVECVSRSVVTLEVMQQAPNGAPRSLGRFPLNAASLTDNEHGTHWEVKELPANGARLRIKLGMRYLDSAGP